ncbi:hypothetical protein CRG98_009574 [Punica granatum]|uniref:Uncharacterized protein n=1 Tax=Punica granatum TaxID=22663 RepID=A0A2I0KNA6_PUNGR|nr:hypothetical protein CRG98_009574 [Punica granatum]
MSVHRNAQRGSELPGQFIDRLGSVNKDLASAVRRRRRRKEQSGSNSVAADSHLLQLRLCGQIGDLREAEGKQRQELSIERERERERGWRDDGFWFCGVDAGGVVVAVVARSCKRGRGGKGQAERSGANELRLERREVGYGVGWLL